jgi:hypothetical protein
MVSNAHTFIERGYFMTTETAFSLLSVILRPYAKDMMVKSDTDTNFYLEETRSSPKKQMFGAVQVKKNYTSFHLFPVYTNPSLLDNLSKELLNRMHGKSCFNFKTAQQVPVAELNNLVSRAFKDLDS